MISFPNFPKYKGININMMPFRPNIIETLPSQFHAYLPLIHACGVQDSREVHFLTIDEREVFGTTHRRGGAHTEASHSVSWGGSPWGGRGGVWMCSNMSNSTRVWDIQIPTDQLGDGGSCSHLDLSQVPSRTLKKYELARISDNTPHESLPISGKRQFFRLVSPRVGAWYSDHSTKNPLCPLPEYINVIKGNKFDNIVLPCRFQGKGK